MRILIVDDHPLMREALTEIIRAQGDLEVCGEAGDATNLLDEITRTKPDLLILDYSMPGRSGLELIKDIVFFAPTVKIIVLSMYDENVYAERVLRAGASGYLMKSAGSETVLVAIRQVLTSGVYVSERISSRLLRNLAHPTPVAEQSPVSQLSDREFEIFTLFGRGLEAAEVAAELHLSRKTVDVHRANIRRKLELPTSAALVCYAAQWNEAATAHAAPH